MTELVIRLPDDLAQRAREAGLLSDGAIQELLEDAMRRQAGSRLLEVARRIQAADVEPMSIDELNTEVRAYRAERRAAEVQGEKSAGSGADRS
ncbi:hypothetical protein [Reyranella sp.]|uniref:hypothetical protein n=1 Tax=Reyranella sp. TaxID=1929291 RepID=UPI0037850F36